MTSVATPSGRSVTAPLCPDAIAVSSAALAVAANVTVWLDGRGAYVTRSVRRRARSRLIVSFVVSSPDARTEIDFTRASASSATEVSTTSVNRTLPSPRAWQPASANAMHHAPRACPCLTPHIIARPSGYR